MTGIVFNAFKLILYQSSEFPFTQTQLEQANRETVRLGAYDSSLSNILRTEWIASLLHHYNLLAPNQFSFGATGVPVPLDVHLVDESSRIVLSHLMRGAMFSCCLPRSRSQKPRHVRLSLLLDRLCLSNVGGPTEVTFELSEIASVNLGKNREEKNTCLKLLVPNHRLVGGSLHSLQSGSSPQLVLECALESERNRWAYYLKVVKGWYLAGGKGLIMEMKNQLTSESLVGECNE